ncbi:hypothetical protein BT69DRAFT_1334031 [Atractiella rhizophila]|nr:hypothetical protein BT69DRAFT_1334031 [Atractiella rhizophila]
MSFVTFVPKCGSSITSSPRDYIYDGSQNPQMYRKETLGQTFKKFMSTKSSPQPNWQSADFYPQLDEQLRAFSFDEDEKTSMGRGRDASSSLKK